MALEYGVFHILMPFICFQSFISMKMRKYFCSNHIFLYFCNGKVSLVDRKSVV